jgi:hypothetical protein
MTEAQAEFLSRLEDFIMDVDHMPRFAGKTQVLTALKRIGKLSVFRKGNA